MKKLFILILIFSFNIGASEFTPTNFTGDKNEIRELFQKLWTNFKEMDNFHCYRRAHVLSYQMSKMEVNTMKAFFFKGDKITMPMNWYYHVAPMVYYNGVGVVMDRALLEGATYLEDWLLAFGDDNKCSEIFSMDEYRAKKKTEFCMYMIVPMYYYGPLDLEEAGLSQFELADLQDMILALPTRARGTYVSLYPLDGLTP